MTEHEREFYWYWLANIPGVGLRSLLKLLEHWGHPSILYNLSEDQLGDFLNPKQLEGWYQSKNYVKQEAGLRQLKEAGFRFLHWESDDYPERLKNLYDPPVGLYLKGRLPDPAQPAIAIVGARKSTPYGRKMADYFSGRMAEHGIAIISGMAAGIDSAAHRSALDHHGYSLGILGGGVDSMYPKDNWNLYLDMYGEGGIISEHNLGVPNHAGLFPMRNRLISGMADAVLVVEAAMKSGSLITADQGMEQGKDIYALPGRVTDVMSQGCNHLISQGAYMAESPEKIIEEILERHQMLSLDFSKDCSRDCSKTVGDSQTRMSIQEGQAGNSITDVSAGKPDLSKDLKMISPEGKRILDLLDYNDPLSITDLLSMLDLPYVRLTHEISQLELQGLIHQPQAQILLKNIM